MNAIPEQWIKKYVDQLLQMADKLGPETTIGKAMMLRASHAMDLVKAYREHGK